MNISMEKCKKKLILLWFIGAAFLFATIIAQTLGKYYGTKADEAWSWFLPTIMPTLSLILGVIILVAKGQSDKRESVDRFNFRIAFILSSVYLFAVALTIYITPFTSYRIFELMKISNYLVRAITGIS
jgi:hypothetical protein